MLITCPSCETRYDLPASRFGADGTMIKCASCGHSWLEARAVEIATVPARQVPAIIEHDESDSEIRRLVEASREAREAFAVRQRARRRGQAAWLAFGLALVSPLVMAAAWPERVVTFAPATIDAYAAMGREVNIYGLDIRELELQHLIDGDVRVLAVKGEIANIAGSERKIPWLRFSLRDASGAEVYHWLLDTGARPLRQGESTEFVTRLAAPPEAARNVEIRFAHAEEIGSNGNHAGIGN